MGTEQRLRAEIRRITEDTRKLRRELEALLGDRTRETRAFSHEFPRSKVLDRPSLARRLGPQR